jgi:hypothetical protein
MIPKLFMKVSWRISTTFSMPVSHSGRLQDKAGGECHTNPCFAHCIALFAQSSTAQVKECGTWPCEHAAIFFHAAGEVPDLLGVDDLEEIGNCLRPIMAAAGIQPITKMSIYSFFVSRYVQAMATWANGCTLGAPAVWHWCWGLLHGLGSSPCSGMQLTPATDCALNCWSSLCFISWL